MAGPRLDPRTGLPHAHIEVLRAVERACTEADHPSATAPTTDAVRQLSAAGHDTPSDRELLAALGHPWRTRYPLLTHAGNWGSPWGDPCADDEYTRVGLSALGHLALRSARGACGPVPLGLVCGDLHPRHPTSPQAGIEAGAMNAPAVLRPGFGIPAVLEALRAARAGEEHPGRHLPVPSSPTGAVVEVDLAALLAGQVVTAHLGCRFESLPPPRVPAAALATPAQASTQASLAAAAGGSTFTWFSYTRRQYAGPTLVITGTPTGVDLDVLIGQLRDAAGSGEPAGAACGSAVKVAAIDDEGSQEVGTRILVRTREVNADLVALREWVTGCPVAREEVRWQLPGGADELLRGWAHRVKDDDTGVEHLAALAE